MSGGGGEYLPSICFKHNLILAHYYSHFFKYVNNLSEKFVFQLWNLPKISPSLSAPILSLSLSLSLSLHFSCFAFWLFASGEGTSTTTMMLPRSTHPTAQNQSYPSGFYEDIFNGGTPRGPQNSISRRGCIGCGRVHGYVDHVHSPP